MLCLGCFFFRKILSPLAEIRILLKEFWPLHTSVEICKSANSRYPRKLWYCQSSLTYPSTKPCKSSEIGSITITHWWSGLPFWSNLSWNCCKFVLRTTTYFKVDSKFFQQKMSWLWEALNHPSLVTSSWSTLRHWPMSRPNTNLRCGSDILAIYLWSSVMVQKI
jgi:hypothetical protein